MMKLFYAPASPFARKAIVLLRETGLSGDVELVHVVGSPVASENMPLAQNPLGKLPTLTRDSGTALYDSRVITRYIDRLAGGGFYPEDSLWEVLTLEATADGMMDAGVLMVYERRCRAPQQQSEEWVEAQWAKIARSLDTLDSRWISHLQAPLNMGQIAVGCALGYLDFRHADRDWRHGRAALADWFATFAARDSMTASAPS